MSVLSKPYFHSEPEAFAFIEGILWPQGPVCPHCGGVDRISAIKPNPEKRVRLGLKKCGQCKGQFTVRMGTIFEESKLPLHKWLQAIFLMCVALGVDDQARTVQALKGVVGKRLTYRGGANERPQA